METTATERHPMMPVLRANAYHALARAFDRPADWQPGFSTSLVEAFEEMGAEFATLARAVAESATASGTDLEPLSVAHARLFVGPFEIAAAPWATFYIDPKQRLMGPATQYAGAAYAEAGLGPGDGPKDAPDHVGRELEFMYYLAFQEATTEEPVWLERQQRFWREHLGRWLPDFASSIQKADAHPYYQALANLLIAFCEREGAVLNS